MVTQERFRLNINCSLQGLKRRRGVVVFCFDVGARPRRIACQLTKDDECLVSVAGEPSRTIADVLEGWLKTLLMWEKRKTWARANV